MQVMGGIGTIIKNNEEQENFMEHSNMSSETNKSANNLSELWEREREASKIAHESATKIFSSRFEREKTHLATWSTPMPFRQELEIEAGESAKAESNDESAKASTDESERNPATVDSERKPAAVPPTSQGSHLFSSTPTTHASTFSAGSQAAGPGGVGITDTRRPFASTSTSATSAASATSGGGGLFIDTAGTSFTPPPASSVPPTAGAFSLKSSTASFAPGAIPNAASGDIAAPAPVVASGTDISGPFSPVGGFKPSDTPAPVTSSATTVDNPPFLLGSGFNSLAVTASKPRFGKKVSTRIAQSRQSARRKSKIPRNMKRRPEKMPGDVAMKKKHSSKKTPHEALVITNAASSGGAPPPSSSSSSIGSTNSNLSAAASAVSITSDSAERKLKEFQTFAGVVDSLVKLQEADQQERENAHEKNRQERERMLKGAMSALGKNLSTASAASIAYDSAEIKLKGFQTFAGVVHSLVKLQEIDSQELENKHEKNRQERERIRKDAMSALGKIFSNSLKMQQS